MGCGAVSADQVPGTQIPNDSCVGGIMARYLSYAPAGLLCRWCPLEKSRYIGISLLSQEVRRILQVSIACVSTAE